MRVCLVPAFSRPRVLYVPAEQPHALLRARPRRPASPVILHVPHSSRRIPADVRPGIVLDDAALERELDHITDSHTEEIAEAAADLAGVTPWRFVNRASRLVVDPSGSPTSGRR